VELLQSDDVEHWTTGVPFIQRDFAPVTPHDFEKILGMGTDALRVR
jgi:hypothetical protein